MAKKPAMKGDDDKGTVRRLCSDRTTKLEAPKWKTDKLRVDESMSRQAANLRKRAARGRRTTESVCHQGRTTVPASGPAL